MVSSQFNITELSKKPHLLGKAEAEWLEQKIAAEPWCSAYRILLSKAYFNEDSFLKNKYLQLAATYSGSREVLFNFIHSPVPNASEEVLKDSPVDLKLDDPVIEPEIIEEESAVNELEKADDLAPAEESKPILEPVSETEEMVADKITDEEIRVPSETELEIDAEKINKEEVVQEGEEDIKPQIDFDKVVTYDPIKELKVAPLTPEPLHDPIPFDTVVYNPEVELNKIIEKKEEAEETGEQDFMFWLNHIGDEPKKSKKSKESIKSPSNVQNLLDQFIATKRSKPIQNREFYNAQNKAQQSETDTMSVISDTLLKIYEKQGYFEKAIEGYQKLSLQNPSKSAYFAARITELKEKHKHSIK